MVKLCKNCRSNGESLDFLKNGYSDNNEQCFYCGNRDLIDINMEAIDFNTIISISRDVTFLESMIVLKKKDPIEYQLKISQFKANLSKVRAEQQSSNQVHCSYCHSTNTEKITSTSKVVNTALWGIFGTKRHKNYHCNDCKSDF